jgi:hypothetical protein
MYGSVFKTRVFIGLIVGPIILVYIISVLLGIMIR